LKENPPTEREQKAGEQMERLENAILLIGKYPPPKTVSLEGFLTTQGAIWDMSKGQADD